MRDRYIWRDPAVRTDAGPPNNWRSVFGGSAWKWDTTTAHYYYPPISRTARSQLAASGSATAMLDVLRFWLDHGVDGFRVDALRQLIKDDQPRDNPPNPAYHPGRAPSDALLPVGSTAALRCTP